MALRTSVYLPDALAEQVKEHDISISEVLQAALRQKVKEAEIKKGLITDMETITVEVGESGIENAFAGRWLVEPCSDETRTRESGYDAGAYWGVALTKRGRIAVYTAHCNERWPAELKDYDTLDEASIPADIRALASRELGDDRPVLLDI